MPESTKYSGNPFISRRERQASVLLYNRKADEVDKEAVYAQKNLTNVKVEISKANGFSTDGLKKLCSCTLWVELRDGNPGYVNFDNWDETDPAKWTIQPGKDYFVANGQKFVVESLIEKYNIKGGVDILEIVGK